MFNFEDLEAIERLSTIDKLQVGLMDQVCGHNFKLQQSAGNQTYILYRVDNNFQKKNFRSIKNQFHRPSGLWKWGDVWRV